MTVSLVAPDTLRVNGMRDAINIAPGSLRLAWTLEYQLPLDSFLRVEVAGSTDDLYAGNLLQSHTLDRSMRATIIRQDMHDHLWWRVGVVNIHDTIWSTPQRIVLQIDLESAGASWVTHPGALRDPGSYVGAYWFGLDIEIPGSSRLSGLLHLALNGVCEVRVDGQLIESALLGPGYAQPRSETPATTVDLGDILPGRHRLTIECASGVFNVHSSRGRYAKFELETEPLRLLAVVRLLDADKLIREYASGDFFFCGKSPTVAAEWYGGEDYVGYINEPWDQMLTTSVVTLGSDAKRSVVWLQQPQIHVVSRIEAARLHETQRGFIADFGVNGAGSVEVLVPESENSQTIEIWPSEQLGPNGVDQLSTGSPIYDRLIAQPGQSYRWRPRFSYHGFRYAEVVSNFPLDTAAVSAVVLRTDNAVSGAFSTDNVLLDRLHTITVQAVENNMFSVFTDCPHREKLGWLEELYLCFMTLSRNFDIEAHSRAVLHHVRYAQLSDGNIPNIAPELVQFTGHGYMGDPDAFRFDLNWAAVVGHLPLLHYRTYGDSRVLEENRQALESYLDYIRQREVDGWVDFGLGDWIALDQSAPRRLVATFGYRSLLASACEISSTLGDAMWRTTLLRDLKRVDEALANSTVGSEATQTEIVLLTAFALATENLPSAARLFHHFLERFELDGRYFTVGEIALDHLLQVLHHFDRDDLIMTTILRDDVPGYGMQLARGMTALAETWSGEAAPGGESSYSHFMLGAIDRWLHEVVGGLKQASSSVGWVEAQFEPVFLDGIDRASTYFDSAAGRYAIEWKRDGDRITIYLEVASAGQATLKLGMQTHMLGPGTYTFTTSTDRREAIGT